MSDTLFEVIRNDHIDNTADRYYSISIGFGHIVQIFCSVVNIDNWKIPLDRMIYLDGHYTLQATSCFMLMRANWNQQNSCS